MAHGNERSMTPMDDFKMVLGMDFLRKVKVEPTVFPTLNGYLGREEAMHGSYGHRRFAQDPYVIGYASK